MGSTSTRFTSAVLTVCFSAALGGQAHAGAQNRDAKQEQPVAATVKPTRAVRLVNLLQPAAAKVSHEEPLDQTAAEMVSKYGASTALARRLAKIESAQPKSFAMRFAERVTNFTGSWGYLIGGLGVIGGWTYMAATGHHFFSNDLLNLGISVATWAVGPMLMMMQTRQSRLDRQRQDALLLLLVETERESRHAERELKNAHADNLEMRTKLANVDLKLDKLTEMLQPKGAPSP
jgi:uncharacterized membrane protein